MLLTTQYLEEADQLADHVVIIDHGRAIATGHARRAEERRPGATSSRSACADADDLGRRGRAARAARQRGAAGRRAEPAGRRRRRRAAPIGCADAVRALAEPRIDIDDVGLRRPTLDEVFLALTGRTAGDETDASTDARAGVAA